MTVDKLYFTHNLKIFLGKYISKVSYQKAIFFRKLKMITLAASQGMHLIQDFDWCGKPSMTKLQDTSRRCEFYTNLMAGLYVQIIENSFVCQSHDLSKAPGHSLCVILNFEKLFFCTELNVVL